MRHIFFVAVFATVDDETSNLNQADEKENISYSHNMMSVKAAGLKNR
jgi:hypothetical protein